MAASRTVSLMVSGTPSAVVVEDPKLERMSLRTIPESSSTLGPFDRSAGNGPAVSSGTSVRSPLPEEEVVAPDAEASDPDGVPDPDPPHAASSAAALSPPNSPSTLRRSTSVCRS